MPILDFSVDLRHESKEVMLKVVLRVLIVEI